MLDRTQITGWWRVLCGLGLGLGLLLGTGCEPTPRFEVPEYQRKPRRQVKRYQVTTKLRLPPTDAIPTWSMIADTESSAVFQPEPVKLQGQLWMRASNSQVFDFYFQRNNLMAGQVLSRVSDQVARFVSVWLQQPFSRRIHVLLVPRTEPVSGEQATSRPAAHSTSQPASQPASRPVARSIYPRVGYPQLVIYTGADNDTKLSEYGLVGELVQASVRWLLTQSTKVQPQRFWRSLAIPMYFDLRGTGAMASPSYNRTTTPRYRQILRSAGFPTNADVVEGIKHYAEFVPLAQQRLVQVSSSFLGFLEDAYGRRVLVLILRKLAASPNMPFLKGVTAVIGKPASVLWTEWKGYFDSRSWRRSLLYKL